MRCRRRSGIAQPGRDNKIIDQISAVSGEARAKTFGNTDVVNNNKSLSKPLDSRG